MILKLNRDAKIPLYIQVKNGIEELIKKGLLKPDTKLPSTRELSGSLGVSRNTIIQGYEQLEVEGYVYSGVGRGTFVHEYGKIQNDSGYKNHFSQFSFKGYFSTVWARSYTSAVLSIEKLWEVNSTSNVISFESDNMDQTYFPAEDFKDSFLSAFRRYGTSLLGAGSSKGFPPLLDYLTSFMARRGIQVKAENILISSGIQQGLSIIGKLFIDPGDTVLLENLTYPGALSVFRSLQANCIGVPLDSDGIRLDIMENVLRRRKAKILYTIPTFQNPLGCTLPIERRQKLVELCRKYNIIVIEDDYAHELSFDGKQMLPLKSWDENGSILYMGSFSETLFPGIRLSWILAPKEIIRKLSVLKKSTDLYTNLILQAAVLEFLQRGFFDKQLKKKRNLLKERNNVVLNALAQYFPVKTSAPHAAGGQFLWVELPGGVDAVDLLIKSRQKGVVFAPDRFFSVEEWEKSGFQIAYGGIDEEKIRNGIKILGNILAGLF